MKIPLYKPYISDNDINAVSNFLKKNTKLTKGKIVKEFENKFCKYTGFKYSVSTNSGTSALHIAVKSLGLKSGDEVITTPFSYIASSNCLIYEGVKPVFVDIDISNLNIDINKVEEKITNKTKAILIVDLFGLPVESRKKINEIKKKYNLLIIEDACESIGRQTKKFPLGKFADIVVYSFHENKQMTTGGEGGMITTNNKIFANSARSFSNQGRSDKKDWIDNVILGYNYRMTEIQAIIGISKLKNLDNILRKREVISGIYYKYLKNKTENYLCPQDCVSSKRSWFIYFIITKNSKDREKLAKFLKSNGIEVAVHYFTPIYKFPFHRQLICNYPNSEIMSSKILVLPMYEELSLKQIKYITSCINKYYI